MKTEGRKTKFRGHRAFQQPEGMHQYACFVCRKVFKRKATFRSPEVPARKCPQCANPLWLAGRAFRAPSNDDIKQWRKAELLIKAGILFHPNDGCKPEDLQEADQYLKRHRLEKKGPIVEG